MDVEPTSIEIAQADIVRQVLDLAVKIQQIPAPPFGEAQRSAFVHNCFQAEAAGKALPLQDVGVDELGNVYGRLPGRGEARPLVICAHLDTVFPQGTYLYVRREADLIHGPGIGDNSLGVAGLFGLLWMLRRLQSGPRLKGDVWFVANVGEEGLGNLRGMRAVVDRFGKAPLAYLVLEGMALGQVYHRGLGMQRYRISVHTAGGHSWVDFGRPSAVHELAALVTHLTALPLPDSPRTTMNVGVIGGGTSINTIAAEAHLELDLRSEGAGALRELVQRVESQAGEAERPGVQVSLELIGQRPAGKIAATHSLVQLAKRCLLAQGLQPNLTIGSTDANLPLSRGLAAICLGITSGSGVHTLEEYIHTRPVTQGLAHLVDFVQGVFKLETG